MKDLFDESRLPVCFFDSGIGGLSLLCECVTRIHDSRFIYFADNFNVPYGSLPPDKLLNSVGKIFEKIAELKPRAAVIACNTVTARCAESLRAKYPFPILGIQPAIKPAAVAAGKCLVLATPLTAASQSLSELVTHFGRGVTRVIACPELAAYIEQNIFDLDEKLVFNMLPDEDADSVVLGCTHYSFIKKIVQARYGCKVFDGLEGTAKHLCSVLGVCDSYNNTTCLNVNNEQEMGKVTFIGGDEEKNRKVFNYLLSRHK